jgi:hypothetical protein
MERAGLLAMRVRMRSSEFVRGLPGNSQWPRPVSSLTVARQRGICTRFPVFAQRQKRAFRSLEKNPTTELRLKLEEGDVKWCWEKRYPTDDSYSFVEHRLGFHLDLKVTRPLASMPVLILWEREHELSFHLAVSI